MLGVWDSIFPSYFIYEKIKSYDYLWLLWYEKSYFRLVHGTESSILDTYHLSDSCSIQCWICPKSKSGTCLLETQLYHCSTLSSAWITSWKAWDQVILYQQIVNSMYMISSLISMWLVLLGINLRWEKLKVQPMSPMTIMMPSRLTCRLNPLQLMSMNLQPSYKPGCCLSIFIERKYYSTLTWLWPGDFSELYLDSWIKLVRLLREYPAKHLLYIFTLTLDRILSLTNMITCSLSSNKNKLYVILPWGKSPFLWVSELFLSTSLSQIVRMWFIMYIGYQIITTMICPQKLWNYSLYSRAPLLNHLNILISLTTLARISPVLPPTKIIWNIWN